MLRASGRPFVACCDMLGGVGSSLEMLKFEPSTPNMLQHGGKRAKHVAPNNLTVTNPRCYASH